MTITAKHTEPTQNSNTAAYGYKYMYDGFGGNAQASHGLSPRHTVTELGSSLWITDANGNSKSVSTVFTFWRELYRPTLREGYPFQIHRQRARCRDGI